MLESKRHFWTVKEFAEALRVDRRTVSDGIKEGTIPATRVGKLIRIPDTWVQEQLDGTVADGDAA